MFSHLIFMGIFITNLLIFQLFAEILPTEHAPHPLQTQNTNLIYILMERKQAIQEEREAIKRSRDALAEEQKTLAEKMANLQTLEITAQTVNEAAIEKDAVRATLENLRLAYQNTQTDIDKQINMLKDKQLELENLRKTTTEATQLALKTEKINALEEELRIQETLVTLAKEQSQNAFQRVEITEKRLELITKWHLTLQETYQTQQKQDLNSRIKREQQNHLSKAAQLRQSLEQLSETDSPSARYLLEVQIQEAEERAQQIERELRITYINEQFEQWQMLITQNNIQISQTLLDNAKSLIKEIEELHTLLQNKIEVLNQQQQVTQKRRETLSSAEKNINKETEKFLVELKERLQQQAKKLPILLAKGQPLLMELESIYKKNRRDTLLRQRQLPKELTEWQSFIRDINTLPTLFWTQGLTALQDFKQAVAQMDTVARLQFGVIVLLWLGFFIFAYNLLLSWINKLTTTVELAYFRKNLLTGLRLLHMNNWGICLSGLFFLYAWFTKLTSLSVYFISILVLSWLIAKIFINFAWLILVEDTKTTLEQHKLYRLLRLNIIMIGVFTVISTLVHLLPTSLLMRDVIDSLFMLLLSLTVAPVMHIRHLFLGNLKTDKKYWFQVIQLSSLLVPLTILTVALLGLVGYINLGWYVAKHLTLFLLVFTSWLVVRGLLTDAIAFLKNIAMVHSTNGLLWTQDIIPLLHRLISLILFAAALWLFFWINGWYEDVAVMSSIQEFFSIPLIRFAESSISLGAVSFSLFSLWMIFWFGSWFRRVTYRWIYTSVDDLGIRNSLSIFTQYVVILIGFLVVFNVIGLDLTTLAVFAGALGVGIGFGLQNIANNFISGILLLIERPLRTGDIVNVGGVHEGKVTRIGIRSLTIKTWDQKDVIIPNSDLISNAFTNWTHSDDYLRITLYVGISYEDDPRLAKEIIVQVLKDNQEILTEPEPAVTLWEFADSAISFRIDYFFHLFNASGFKTREDILFAIWERFEKAGITIPYPQRTVHLNQTIVR